MEDTADESRAWFEINPALDLERLHDDFRDCGRVQIDNFLNPPGPAILYRELSADIEWRSFLVANERLLATSLGGDAATRREEEREAIDRAHDGARYGFAYLYDADAQ